MPVTPTPPVDPRALTVANVTGSIQANKDFVDADLADLQVKISKGSVVTVWTKPNGDEIAVFNATARNTLAVSRAVLGYYPKATKVIVRTRVDVTDKFGKAFVDDTMFIMVTKATAAKFGYDGLAGRILGDEIQMFCLGDDAFIPPYISNHLSSDTLASWVTNCA